MQEAKKLHAHIIINGFQQQETNYLRKLITFLAISNPSSLNYARLIFDQIQHKSTFVYNTMIRAYSSSCNPQNSFVLYNQMHRNGRPSVDKYTFPFLLKACSVLGDIRTGEETHCQAVKNGFSGDVFVQNSLIHFYGSNANISSARLVFDEMFERDVATWTTLVSCYANHGSIETACKLFKEMPEKSVVSFSAMITGCVRKGRFDEAFEFFRELQIRGLEPNNSTVMGVISASANLGSLDTGKWIHSYIRNKKGNDQFDSYMNTALIDMYFKCGSIKDAIHVFEGVKVKLVGEWTAMISGMAMHGFGERSVELFENMVELGVKPNAITFVGLLSGCTHAGLVKEGLTYFKRMKSEFGIEPTIEHFGCVVDLLSRAGLIAQAVTFMNNMPLKANAAIWGAILNACRVHKNVEVGELAARWLLREEPWNAGVYMSLLSLYTEADRWDDVVMVKREMKEIGSRKSPGCSLVEVNGVSYEFVAGDKSYPPALQVSLQIDESIKEVKEDYGNLWD